jgi:dihydroorotase
MILEQVVEKTAHNPAIRYAVQERGFIREGYFADLVLVDCKASTSVTNENSLYHCQWSPFAGHEFQSAIKCTWVNGCQVYADGEVLDASSTAMRLAFTR